MRPIDPTVANQLEAGYRELKPHTETWNDELRCAVEVGPLGEEKVSHPLWPKTPTSKSSKKPDDLIEPPISSNPFVPLAVFMVRQPRKVVLYQIQMRTTPHPSQFTGSLSNIM